MKCTLKEFIAGYIEKRLKDYRMSCYLGSNQDVKKEDAKNVWKMYMGVMSQGDDWHNA